MVCSCGNTPTGASADGSDADRDVGARLRLFGGFQLSLDGKPVALPISEQRLLAFLGVQGPSPRAIVAGRLWADTLEHNALASLRTTLWRLGRRVASLIESTPEGLALATAVAVDIHLLTKTPLRMIRSPNMLGGRVAGGELLDELLDKAELLPGWYDDWVIFERERLRQLRLHALEALAERLMIQRDYASALEAALECVRIEPLRESGHRHVIAIHLAENNVVEGLRHYNFACDLLRSELGVEPSIQLTTMLVPSRIRQVDQPRSGVKGCRRSVAEPSGATTASGA